MWLLNGDQAARLTALQRRRDLQRMGAALAEAFPEAAKRAGDRWPEFIEHGTARAVAYRLTHLLCVARFLAGWIACGSEFEARQPWAAAILTDDQRSEGAKVYQLCIRVLEHLRSSAQPGLGSGADFTLALKRLDETLAPAGTLASLLPRERIRLGAACDLDAAELRLVGTDWRQHYTAEGGAWRREAITLAGTSITLLHDAADEASPAWPAQVTLLSRPAGSGTPAQLRVRVKAEHRCDPLLHPWLQCLDPGALRSLRGDTAWDATLAVQARPRDEEAPLPHIGEEDSPQFSPLRVAACGLRASGVSIGQLSTLLAAYDATQHLSAWRREPMPAWELPAEAPPKVAAARCRRELDGQLADVSAWVRGFHELDAQLQAGVERLLVAWERESGVADGKLAVDAALLVGSAGIAWGWAETPAGIGAPPYMRLEGLLDLVACRLTLCFSGVLARAGSRTRFELTTDGSSTLAGPWKRGPDDAALFVVASALQRQIAQPFVLALQPLADAGLAMLLASGPLQGAIRGSVGLEQRPDGPGLRWFVRLAVEPVSAPVRIVDPLLGVQALMLPLLPAQPLVDWSLA